LNKQRTTMFFIISRYKTSIKFHNHKILTPRFLTVHTVWIACCS